MSDFNKTFCFAQNQNTDPWANRRGEATYKPHFNTRKDLPLTEILNEIANIVGNSFGPHGSTTIIEDLQLHHKVSKDGYTILRSLTSTDDLERVVLELVKRVSLRLVHVVGDGSTSAIIVASKIANNLKKFLEENPGLYRGDVTYCLDVMSKKIQELIQREVYHIDESKEEDWQKIYDVATVATNNNKEAAELITETYKKVGKFGVVQVQRGDYYKNTVDYKVGFSMFRGFADDAFCNVKKDDRCYVELDNVHVIMLDGTVATPDLEALVKIVNFILNNKLGSILLIANNFSNDVMQFCKENVLRNKIPLCLCMHGTGSIQGRAHFGDIATYNGCRVVEFLSKAESLAKTFLTKDGEIDPVAFKARTGFAKKVISKEMETIFFEGKGVNSTEYKELKSSLQKRIEELQNKESHIDFDSELNALKVRYGRLCASSAVITVGGQSKAAIDTFADLMEDAVLSCKSALQFGVVAAGNIITPTVILDHSDEIAKAISETGKMTEDMAHKLCEIVFKAYTEVFAVCAQVNPETVEKLCEDRKIINIRTGNYESIDETHVLNSARTDTEIIAGAMSVVSLLVTSNGFVFYPN
jgi:chaperonin GroEL